jgi:hypothetical protein
MSAVQLNLAVLPVAETAFAAEAAREQWLLDVLGSARAYEREQCRWWTGATLANRMRQNPARVGPALRCLEERGAVLRVRLGVTMRNEPVFVYAVNRGAS